MKKKYCYPRSKIIIVPYVIVLFMPLILVWLYMKHQDSALGVMALIFFLLMDVPILVWLFYNLSVRFEVDDHGITKKSFLGSKSINWNEVKSVKWRRLYDAEENNIKPSDITIMATDGKTMDVLSIIENNDGASTMAEFEDFLQIKVTSIAESKQYQQNQDLHRLLRLMVIGGVLGVIFGLLMLQRPINPQKEKLGFISQKIGMSADAIALITSGVIIMGCGIYKIRRAEANKS